ncbi:hypothetical protein VTK26DRAFT_319 [Humicola hyalothermophila]
MAMTEKDWKEHKNLTRFLRDQHGVFSGLVFFIGNRHPAADSKRDVEVGTALRVLGSSSDNKRGETALRGELHTRPLGQITLPSSLSTATIWPLAPAHPSLYPFSVAPGQCST